MTDPLHHAPPELDSDALLSGESADLGDIPAAMGIVGELGEAKIIEYAPGQYAAILAPEIIPRYGVVVFQHVGKNEYRPKIVGWGKMISLYRFFRERATGNEPHPVLRRLGLDLCYNSVLRLYKNGFVKGCMPVPHRILIDLESLNRHLQEASDPDFWTEDRVKRFKETIY